MKERSICILCSKHPQKVCKKRFSKYCSACEHRLYETQEAKEQRYKTRGKWKNKYVKYKKTYCETCSFKPIHPVQLDVDHIDGNHNNNDPSNLQTLCANCHRLKTLLCKDGIFRDNNG